MEQEGVIFIEGKPHAKTAEGYVAVDAYKSIHPMAWIAIILLFLYTAALTDVIAKVLQHKTNEIGPLSLYITYLTRFLFGEGTTLIIAINLFLMGYLMLVRKNIGVRFIKTAFNCFIALWLFSAGALLYGFETENANVVANATFGVIAKLFSLTFAQIVFWGVIAAITLHIVHKTIGFNADHFLMSQLDHLKKKVEHPALLSLKARFNQWTAKLTANQAVTAPLTPFNPQAENPMQAVQTPDPVKQQIAEYRQRFAAVRTARTHDVTATFTPSSEQFKAVKRAQLATAAELVQNAKPIETVIDFIPVNGICMITAPSGCGKTRFVLALVYALATGQKSFLGFAIPQPRRVLYIDGEMGSNGMGNRLKAFPVIPEAMSVLCYDVCETFPNILETDGQQEIINALDEFGDDNTVVVLDSLKTLSQGKIDNNPKPFVAFVAQLKKRCTVVVIHHTNKEGKQAGSANNVVWLDNHVSLEPTNASNKNQVEFTLKFEKVRESNGSTQLVDGTTVTCDGNQWQRRTPEGVYSWTPPAYAQLPAVHNDLHNADYAHNMQHNQLNMQNMHDMQAHNMQTNISDMQQYKEIYALHKKGLTQKAIGDQLGIDQSTVSRILKKQSASA